MWVVCLADGETKALLGAIVLAAGTSQRMGVDNKLLALINGRAMILAVVDAVPNNLFSELHVIIGYEAEKIETVLKGQHVQFVRNENYASGMASSLKIGLEQLSETDEGILVLLGDMPYVTGDTMAQLVGAFVDEYSICAPVFRGRRGNPVLWGRGYFDEMMELEGDVGARALLQKYKDRLIKVEVDDAGILQDVDTCDALKQL